MNFKIIGCFMISAGFAFTNDINGIYLLPKDSKDKQSVVEIFSKNKAFYGVGFTTTNGINKDVDSNNPNKSLQNRPIRGSIFLNMKCNNNKCNGKIYSFEKGKTYPIKAMLKNNTLEIKVDVLFGPMFIWQKLDETQALKYNNERLDINALELMQ